MKKDSAKLIVFYRTDLIEKLESVYAGCYFYVDKDLSRLNYIVSFNTVYIPFIIEHYQYNFKLRFLK